MGKIFLVRGLDQIVRLTKLLVHYVWTWKPGLERSTSKGQQNEDRLSIILILYFSLSSGERFTSEYLGMIEPPFQQWDVIKHNLFELGRETSHATTVDAASKNEIR